MYARLLVLFLSFQIAVAPLAYAGPAAQVAKRVAKDVAGLGETAVKTKIQANVLKRVGTWAGRLVIEYGGDVIVVAAASTTIFALAFNQIFAGADFLADIQHTEAERNEDYLRRVWGFYLNDPEFVTKVPDTIQKATKWVNDSCVKKGLKCRVDPRQVFLSPVHDIVGTSGTIANQETCIFQVPADDFINENPVQTVGLHLAQLIAWCDQIPGAVFAVKEKYNEDGTNRHWYSVQDEIPFYKAASVFALDLLGLPSEMPHSILGINENDAYFSREGAFTQKYFNVGKSFAAYSKDFNDRDDQGKIFDTSAAWLNSHGLQIRLQTIPYIYADDSLVLSSCGRDEVEKLFYGPIAPCQTIIPGPVLQAKIQRITRGERGTTTTLGTPDDKASLLQRAKDWARYWGLDAAGGTLANVLIFDVIGKKLRAGKKVEEVAADFEKIGEEEIVPLVAKTGLWQSVKNAWLVRWTGKSIKFVTRSAVFTGIFAVGSSITDWSIFGHHADFEAPEDVSDELSLLNALAKDSRFYRTRDKPQDQDAKYTSDKLRAILNSKDNVKIKIIADLAEKPSQASQTPQKAQQ